MRRLILGVATGAALLISVGGVVAVWKVVSFDRALGAEWDIPPEPLVASTDPAVLARGEHIARSYGGCTGCHGLDLGGKVVEDLGPIGVMAAPNLTTGEGGVGGDYTDGELARAIRHGVGVDRTSLTYMPTVEHAWWPDEDLQAVVSWIRAQPPVDREAKPAVVRPLGKVLSGFGIVPLLSAEGVDHDAARPEVVVAETAEYGALLALSCSGCHGENFAGGALPGVPADLPAPTNLTLHETGLRGWSRDDFVTALRTGIRPDGTEIDPFMPIEDTRSMTDLELGALYRYFSQLPPRRFGEH